MKQTDSRLKQKLCKSCGNKKTHMNALYAYYEFTESPKEGQAINLNKFEAYKFIWTCCVCKTAKEKLGDNWYRCKTRIGEMYK